MSKVKKTYAALGRLSYKAITPFLKLYATQKHVRVRTLIVNEAKEVLLVRSWLGNQFWSLPGGGLKLGETPAQAAVREVREETGLHIAESHLAELGIFRNIDSRGKPTFTVACFQIEIAKREPRMAKYRRLEMLDIAWFPLANLPKQLSPTAQKAIELYRGL